MTPGGAPAGADAAEELVALRRAAADLRRGLAIAWLERHGKAPGADEVRAIAAALPAARLDAPPRAPAAFMGLDTVVTGERRGVRVWTLGRREVEGAIALAPTRARTALLSPETKLRSFVADRARGVVHALVDGERESALVEVQLLDGATREALTMPRTVDSVVARSGDGTRHAVAVRGAFAAIRDAAGEARWPFPAAEEASEVAAAVVVPEGILVCTAGLRKARVLGDQLLLVGAAGVRLVATLMTRANCLATDPTGRWLAVGTLGSVYLVDLRDGLEAVQRNGLGEALELQGPDVLVTGLADVVGVAFDSTGRLAAVSQVPTPGAPGRLTLYDVVRRVAIASRAVSPTAPRTLDLSPDGKLAVLGTKAGGVEVWAFD